MISVADLLLNQRLPGNYFALDTYVRGDLELGLLLNRQGDRLLALPMPLIQGIYSGLDKETGQAARLVLFNCGRWWGKSFYTRFIEQMTHYYDASPGEMPMGEFLLALQQCWIAHGWGKIDLDQTYQQRGFLGVKIWNSAFAMYAPKSEQPVCYLEAGVLSAFFSQLTGRDLNCVQTECESLGAECNRFILGLPNRLRGVETMVGRLTHEELMQQLCQP